MHKMEAKKMVKLYKIINGNLVFVDYGVKSQVDNYAKQNYIIMYNNPKYKNEAAI